MFEKILTLIQRLDLKWWISLKAQQMLTLLMSVLIIVFFSTTVMLFIQGETRVKEVRISKNEELAIERAKSEALGERLIKLLEKYERLFFETERLKIEIKTENNDNKNL